MVRTRWGEARCARRRFQDAATLAAESGQVGHEERPQATHRVTQPLRGPVVIEPRGEVPFLAQPGDEAAQIAEQNDSQDNHDGAEEQRREDLSQNFRCAQDGFARGSRHGAAALRFRHVEGLRLRVREEAEQPDQERPGHLQSTHSECQGDIQNRAVDDRTRRETDHQHGKDAGNGRCRVAASRPWSPAAGTGANVPEGGKSQADKGDAQPQQRVLLQFEALTDGQHQQKHQQADLEAERDGLGAEPLA